MRNLSIKPAAQDDLDAIFDYTFNQWGFEQASEYTQAIYDACAELADAPEKAQTIDDIRKGYRRWHVASHSIYFTVSASEMVVVRILNQKMHAREWLS